MGYLREKYLKWKSREETTKGSSSPGELKQLAKKVIAGAAIGGGVGAGAGYAIGRKQYGLLTGYIAGSVGVVVGALGGFIWWIVEPEEVTT